MSNTKITEIIEICLQLEIKAEFSYQLLSDSAQSEELSNFWQSMAHQEANHINYWQKVLALSEKGKIPEIFDYPDKIVSQLNDIKKQVAALMDKNESYQDIAASFLFAYKLEFILMHPAFAALFLLLRKETGNKSPADAYHAHIKGLIKMLHQFQIEKPEFELIGDLMSQLWERNTELAKELAEIKMLRGLVPICMHCKNMRDDKGYWNRLEKYIEDRSEVTFSHGICPDCLEKYYPDLKDK